MRKQGITAEQFHKVIFGIREGKQFSISCDGVSFPVAVKDMNLNFPHIGSELLELSLELIVKVKRSK